MIVGVVIVIPAEQIDVANSYYKHTNIVAYLE